MSTVQVGFSPAAAGSSVTTGVAAGAVAPASGGTGAQAGPLGFLAALLDLLGQSLGLPEVAGGQTPGNGQPASGNGQPASGNGLSFLPPSAAAAVATDAAMQSGNDPRQLGAKGQKLLNDLISALSAMDEAGDSGQPVDPALEKKLSDTIDGIAGLLGITLPAPPAVDPVVTEASASLSGAPTQPLEPTPPPAPDVPLPADVPLPLPQADAASPATAADDFAAAVQTATAPRPPRDADEEDDRNTARKADGERPATSQADAHAADKPAPAAPESRIARLVDKLQEVAEKLDARSPAVAEKLQKLADVLAAASGDDKAALAKLGADLDDVDIAALTASKPDSKPAPAPQIFTQPVLPVAAAAVKAETDATKAESQPAEKSAEPADATKPDDKPKETSTADAKPADKPAIDVKPRERSDFGQHLAEVRADRQADAANQNQAGQQGVAAAGRADAAVAPKAVHAAYQAPVQQINVPQVAFEVVRQFHQGHSRFQIRLDPPELGRIDVRMHMDGDGNVQAKMTVERIETLDLMQRDQRHLEKALAQAGLDSSKTSLEFSLRQNPQGRDGQQFAQQWQQQQQGDGNRSPWQRQAAPGTPDLAEITTTTQYRGLASPSGVNLFV